MAFTKQNDESRIMGVLNQNSDKNFVKRILKPEGKPILELGGDNFATHKMAWTTANGRPIVFPKVIQNPKTGQLQELPMKDAIQHALKNNEFITMKNRKDAEWFSSNYKKVWNMDGKNITLKKGLPQMANNDQDRLSKLAQRLTAEQPAVVAPQDNLESAATRVAQEQGALPKPVSPEEQPDRGLVGELQQAGGVMPLLRQAGQEAAQVPSKISDIAFSIPQGAQRALFNIPGISKLGLRPTPVITGGGIPQKLGEAIGVGGIFAAPGGLAGAGTEAALGGESLLARLAAPAIRTATGGVTGAAISPSGQRAMGGILGILGQGATEALPAVTQAAKTAIPAIQRSAAGQLFGSIKDSISGIMDKIKGGETAEDLNPELLNRTSQHFDEVKGTTKGGQPLDDNLFRFRNPGDSNRAAFNDVTNAEDKLKTKLGNKYFFHKKAWLNSIDDAQNQITKKLTQFPDNPQAKDAQEFLNRAKKYNFNSIKAAMDVPPELNNEWRIADTKDNPLIKRLTGNLKEGVRQGMQDTAAGNPAIKNLFNKATNKFKKEVVPFQEFGGKPTDFIKRYRSQIPVSDKFIENNVKFNQPQRLQHFMSRLPDQESRNLVAAHLFGKEADNPDAFIRKYRKFDQKSRQLLFPEHHQELNKLLDLKSRTPQAFKETPTAGTLGRLGRGALGLFGGADILRGQFAPGALLSSPLLAREATQTIAKLPGMRERILQSLLRGKRPPIPISRPGLPSRIAAGSLLSRLGTQQGIK